MDFIEHWLGINPDGGSGSLEALYLIVIALAAAALAWRLRRRPVDR